MTIIRYVNSGVEDHEQGEEEGGDEGEYPTLGLFLRREEVLEILKIPRLQALQALRLDFPRKILWQDLLVFLDMTPLSVKRLSLLSLWPTPPPKPRPSLEVLAMQLVEKLAKFEEVDFADDGFLRLTEVQKAVLTELSIAGDSKLKVLTVPGFEKDSDLREARYEARKKLTINLRLPKGAQIWLMMLMAGHAEEDEEENSEGDEDSEEGELANEDPI